MIINDELTRYAHLEKYHVKCIDDSTCPTIACTDSSSTTFPHLTRHECGSQPTSVHV